MAVYGGKSSPSTKDTITRIQFPTDVYSIWLRDWQGILVMILMRNGRRRLSLGCKISVCLNIAAGLRLELMTSDYSIHDGADVPDCTQVDEIQWTYNNGQFLVGSAYMYNYVRPPLTMADGRQMETHTGKTNSTSCWPMRSRNSSHLLQTFSSNLLAK